MNNLEMVYIWAIKDKPSYNRVMEELEGNKLFTYIISKRFSKNIRSITLKMITLNHWYYLYLTFKGNGKFLGSYVEYEERLL